jgi:DNA-binding transcriptional regulator LsrR (DeoR family)
MRAVGLGTDDHFELPMTQTDLADALGISVVHVNRTLQELRRAGLMDHRKYVVTLGDAERLMELGGFDDDYLHQNPQAASQNGGLTA